MRFMDVVKEDIADLRVTEENTENRNNWIWKIRCGDPLWEKPKEEEEQDRTQHVSLNVTASVVSNQHPVQNVTGQTSA